MPMQGAPQDSPRFGQHRWTYLRYIRSIRVATSLTTALPHEQLTLRCFPPSTTSLKPQQMHFRSGWKKHGYPSHDIAEFSSFLQEQWSIHLQALQQVPRLTVESYFPVESDSWRTGSHPSCWSSKPECQKFFAHSYTFKDATIRGLTHNFFQVRNILRRSVD